MKTVSQNSVQIGGCDDALLNSRNCGGRIDSVNHDCIGNCIPNAILNDGVDGRQFGQLPKMSVLFSGVKAHSRLRTVNSGNKLANQFLGIDVNPQFGRLGVHPVKARREFALNQFLCLQMQILHSEYFP